MDPEREKLRSLINVMTREGAFASFEEDMKRDNVLDRLEEIVESWSKVVASRRRIHMAGKGARIITYGSDGLGVHGSSSDIDILCVGPAFATREDDFFIVLRKMLQSRSEVSELVCVTAAKVPLIRFKIGGVSVDLAYAQLPFLTIPDNMDLFEPDTLAKMDTTSLNSCSGVRCNQSILKQLPIYKNFPTVLRCVKLWAIKRGIYSNLNGFLGGVHLVVLVAFVCCKNPDDSINDLISKFFETYATWEWPTPVSLVDAQESQTSEADLGLMPILMPFVPYEVCRSYITSHTFTKIRAEFQRAFLLLQAGIRTAAEWMNLFDSFDYAIKYNRFVKIILYAQDAAVLNDWVGYVKSRFHLLIEQLENVQGFCDPNPTDYVDASLPFHNKIFYWGLSPSQSSFNDIDSVEFDFMERLRVSGVDDYLERGAKLRLNIVGYCPRT